MSQQQQASGDGGGGGRPRKYSDEELLSWIDAYVREFGFVPSCYVAKEWPGPSYSTYNNRFGGWIPAVRKAGYEPQGERGGESE